MLVFDGQIFDAVEKHLRIDEAMGKRLHRELPISLAAGDALREHQVVRLEAERDRTLLRQPTRWDLDSDQAPLPSCGRLRRLPTTTSSVS